MGFWDHWVPGANKALTDLVNEWAAKEKIEAQIDYITSQGNKILLTVSAEAQAKTGHDILVMTTWLPHANAELLEPVNDIMAPIIKQNGAVNDTVNYLGQANGKWLGVPSCVGSQIKGPCSRIDLMKKYANIDVQQMYPVGSPPRADNWTMETFLKAAEACYKGGLPFGIGLGQTADSVDTAGAVFQSFGAQLVDAKGNLAVKTDEVRKALEFYKKLIAFLPPDVPAWDDASNNKWLITVTAPTAHARPFGCRMFGAYAMLAVRCRLIRPTHWREQRDSAPRRAGAKGETLCARHAFVTAANLRCHFSDQRTFGISGVKTPAPGRIVRPLKVPQPFLEVDLFQA